MNDIYSLYIKLIIRHKETISVTYYSHKEGFVTKPFKVETYGSHDTLVVYDEFGKSKDLPFFGKDIMIQSITFENENEPVYYNDYIGPSIHDIFTEEYREYIKHKVFPNYDERKRKAIKRFNNYRRWYDTDSFLDLFFTEKQKEEFEEFFKILTAGIARYCVNRNLDSTLKEINHGCYSNVYKIGDIIIKLGKEREQKQIPYCEYLLQPIINKTYYFDGFPIRIEITQEAKTYSTDQTIIGQIRKSILNRKLRKIGLKCDDLNIRNIGILKKDNKIDYPSIDFCCGNEETTSIENNNSSKILKKGKTVIIDLDNIDIINIDNYCNYLETTTVSKESIQKVKAKYYKKHKASK